MQRLLPPHLFALLTVVSVVLGVRVPLVGPAPWPLRIIALVPFVVGARLTVASARRFDELGTNIKTFDDPDHFVDDGAFRRTRNPMYLGFAAMLAGIAAAVGSLSAWVSPLVFVAAAERWYIPFEERRMADRFGAVYEDYRRRVPRWIGVGA